MTTTPEAPTSMAAAIEAGVQTGNEFNGVEAPAPQESDNDDPNISGTPGDEAPDTGDDAPGDSGVPAGTATGETVPDGQAPAAGDVPAVGADGKPLPGAAPGKAGDAGAAKTPEQLEAARLAALTPEQREAEALKKALEDPIPNALKGPTKERIKTLIGTAKQATERATKAQQSLDTIVQRVRDTGSSPEQYGQALTYLQMVNSGDRTQIIKALEFIEGERVALARMAGVALPGVSMLNDYPDLEAEVHAGKLTRERAEEIAAQRASTEHADNVNRNADQTAATRQAHQRAVERAQGELNAEEARLTASDPAYKVKRPIILKILLPQIQAGKFRPTEWLPEFKRLYNELPAPVAARTPTPGARPGQPANGGGNPPLRATQPAGGAVAAPKSMAEAIDFGVSEAGRR